MESQQSSSSEFPPGGSIVAVARCGSPPPRARPPVAAPLRVHQAAAAESSSSSSPLPFVTSSSSSVRRIRPPSRPHVADPAPPRPWSAQIRPSRIRRRSVRRSPSRLASSTPGRRSSSPHPPVAALLPVAEPLAACPPHRPRPVTAHPCHRRGSFCSARSAGRGSGRPTVRRPSRGRPPAFCHGHPPVRGAVATSSSSAHSSFLCPPPVGMQGRFDFCLRLVSVHYCCCYLSCC